MGFVCPRPGDHADTNTKERNRAQLEFLQADMFDFQMRLSIRAYKSRFQNLAAAWGWNVLYVLLHSCWMLNDALSLLRVGKQKNSFFFLGDSRYVSKDLKNFSPGAF